MDKETAHPVIDLMEEQKNIQDYGGTMRLGAYDCKLKKNSRSYSAYGDTEIKERHRHRYEFNNKYLKDYEAAGMKAAGTNPDSGLVEIMEIPKHPYFVGVQFHPELKSTVMTPHPLFISFIDAVVKSKKNKLN
jgi:CTP synthase